MVYCRHEIVKGVLEKLLRVRAPSASFVGSSPKGGAKAD